MTAQKKAPPGRTVDWTVIEGAYRAGIRSINSLAGEYGITEGAIRARAKKHGWVRNPGEAKREIVAAHMAGVTNGITNDVVRNIEDAAREDVADMERGLRINRRCLINLELASGTATDPKEIKTIVDASSAAIESIRRIRGLDKPTLVNGGDALGFGGAVLAALKAKHAAPYEA